MELFIIIINKPGFFNLVSQLRETGYLLAGGVQAQVSL